MDLECQISEFDSWDLNYEGKESIRGFDLIFFWRVFGGSRLGFRVPQGNEVSGEASEIRTAQERC